MSRVVRALGAGVRELARTPVLVGLLAFLPAYLVGVFTFVAPDVPAVIRLASGATVQTSLVDAMPTFTTPMAAALLTAITGLFLMQSSSRADARLVLAGYRVRQVVAARIGVLALVALVGSVVAVEVLGIVARAPDSVLGFYAGTLMAAMIYGSLGLLVGTLLDRLAGVYLILFGSLVDLFVFQNPLAQDPPMAARLLPGHFPMEVAISAAFEGTVETVDLVGSLAVLAGLGLLATGALYAAVDG